MKSPRKSFLEELKWRGTLHDATPRLENQLASSITSAYIGFDLTGPSLHIGSLAAIILLKRWQQAGHKPIILLGGGTSLIGDPSGKKVERQLLNEATIKRNQAGIQAQLMRFLDFTGPNKAEIFNNYDWLHKLNYIDFLRDIGKYIPLTYMLAKDSVKTRLASGISFTEFNYQLLQAYDFYHLHEHHNVKVQLGGADQWGNITTGTTLIRKKTGQDSFALTTKLITRADGTKFGKTAQGNNIWLDANLTTPYQFYQFCYNLGNEVTQLYPIFTFKKQQAVEAITQQHLQDPSKRLLQKALAQELTTSVHSPIACQQAQQATQVLFGNVHPNNVSMPTLAVLAENIPTTPFTTEQLKALPTLTHLLTEGTKHTLFTSRRNAREVIASGGLQLNGAKITDPEQGTKDLKWLHNSYLLVKKGKKNYQLLKKV